MQKFNFIFILALSILSGSILSGCSLPRPEKADKQQVATFNVEVKNVAFTETQHYSDIAIPKEKTLLFDLCFTDLQYGKPIPQHQFFIDTTSSQIMTTNSLGCFSWTEKIEYNHLADFMPVQIYRLVSARGYQKGSRIISAIINPWEDKATAVKDVRLLEIPDPAISAKKLKGQSQRPLWIKAGFVHIGETKGLKTYTIDLQAEPKVLLKNMVGEEITYPISKGTFLAKIHLIHTLQNGSSTQKTILAKSEAGLKAFASGGIFNLSTQLEIPYICTRGQLELALEVTPVTEMKNITPFTGIYSLGVCENLIGKQFLRLKSEVEASMKVSEFSVAQYLGPQSQTDKDNNRPPDSVHTTSVQILPLTATPIRYIEKSLTLRERVFNLDICFESSVERRGLRTQSFEIIGLSGKKLTAKSLNNGCVRIEDSLEFAYLAPECLKRGLIHIKNTDFGLDEKIPVELNPSTENGVFFQDLRPLVRTQQIDYRNDFCAKGKTIMLSTGYSFDKVNYDYSIDESLSLTITKRGKLKLYFTLNRPSFSTSRGAEELPLPVGDYLLRWAIVDINSVKSKQYKNSVFSIGEKRVKVLSNSTIADEIGLSLTNMKAVGNTNYIFFEVSPLDPKAAQSGLLNATFGGVITIIRDMEGSNLEIIEDPQLMNLLHKQYTTDKQEIKNQLHALSTKQSFAQKTGLKLVNLNTPLKNFRGLNTESILYWINKGEFNQPLTAYFCNYWVDEFMLKNAKRTPHARFLNEKNKLTNLCIRKAYQNPLHFFDIEYRYFVSQVSSKFMNSSYRDLNVYQNYTVFHGFSINEGSGYSIDGGFSLKLPEFLSFLSASAGARYTLMNHYETDSKSWGNGFVLSSGMSLTVETAQMEITAEEYEKCAVIKLNINTLNEIEAYAEKRKDLQIINQADFTHLPKKGFVFCQGQKNKKKISFPENYYVLNQKAQETTSVDSRSEQSRGFFAAIRGRADFLSFSSLLYDQITIPESLKADYQQSHLLNDPTQPIFNRGFRSFPGQIVAPR